MSAVLLMGVASLSTPRSCACKRCAQPRTVSMVSSTPRKPPPRIRIYFR